MRHDDITAPEFDAAEKVGVALHPIVLRGALAAQNALRDKRRDKWMRERIAQEIEAGRADAISPAYTAREIAAAVREGGGENE